MEGIHSVALSTHKKVTVVHTAVAMDGNGCSPLQLQHQGFQALFDHPTGASNIQQAV